VVLVLRIALLVADVAPDDTDDARLVVSDGDQDPLAVEVAECSAALAALSKCGVDQLVVAEAP
jgi:hypothetical protein